MPHTVGGVVWESAVVVRVPAFDREIAALRRRFGLPLKPNGIPPHITVVVPFLAREELADDRQLPVLREVCRSFEPFDVTFSRSARFPRVLYLVPEPADPFIALARALRERWPDQAAVAARAKPMVPHLTVTTSRPARVFNAVDETLAPLLPVRVQIDGAQLYLFDGRRWTEDAQLPFTPR